MQVISTFDTLASVLADGKAVGKTLDGLKVRLFTNNIAITPDRAITDFTTATFPGYADSSLVVWSPVTRDTLDRAVLRGGEKVFIATGPGTPELIFGWLLFLPGAPDVLRAAALFDAAVPVNQADDAVIVHPYFPLPPDA